MAKILCIEDEAAIRQILVDELSDVGHDVVEAANGKLGLESILAQKPDLVLCDITMPEMDGHTVLKELRSSRPELADLPFIFLSALADRAQIVAGKKLGADDYLTKPIDFELLFATIDSRLNQVQRMMAHKEEQFVKLYRSFREETDEEEPGSQQAPSNAGLGESVAAPKQGPKKATGAVYAQIQALAKKTGGSVIAGQVQVVGLEGIRVALGEQWPGRFQQVRQIAESTITQRLSHGDVFEYSEGSNKFLICFASLDEQSGKAKAQSISREIREKVIGSEKIDSVIKENCGVTSDVHEISITPSDLASSENVVDMVISRVSEAARVARAREERTIAQLVSSCQIVVLPVMGEKWSQTAFAVAQFDAETLAGISALQSARPGDDSLAAEIDIVRLGRTSELLCDQTLETRSVILVNVSFSTLDNRRLLESYQKLCASLTDATKGRLAFNIIGIPKDTVSSRLLSLSQSIRQTGQFISLELSEMSLGALEPATLQAPILTCSFQSMRPRVAEKPDALDQLCRSLRDQKAQLLIYDIPTSEDGYRLLRRGVDLVACRS